MVKLFLKNSNLCDHNSPTSQTDRQTHRQTTCDRNTALCTKVHRAVKTRKALKQVENFRYLGSVIHAHGESEDIKARIAAAWKQEAKLSLG